MKFIEKLLGLSIIMILLFNMVLVLTVPRARAQSTYIYVDPSEVTGVLSGESFVVNINVSEAPLTCGWGIHLGWDPSLLELVQIWDPYWKPDPGEPPGMWVDIMEGAFLDRRYWTPFGWMKEYTTSFFYDPLVEANDKGEIHFGCTLSSDVPMINWASGNGWLCSLNFTVQDEGSTLLNLFETSLADHYEGDPAYPAYSPYPNNDCFFRNAATPIHDLRITDITVLNASVRLGEIARINVTVLNEGTVTETFDLYVYADIDTPPIGDEITIPSASHSLNGAGNSEDRSSTYEITWNTGGCSKAFYTISAYVQPVLGEADTDDNTRTDGTVQVTKMLGDVDGDDEVDDNDLFLFGKAYGTKLGDHDWNENCDFNVDLKVDDYDLFILGKNYTGSA